MLHATIFIVSLPLTYCAIRYVPLTNPYVKFYYIDNHMFHKVHKENKRGKDFYISFEEMLLNPLGRIKIMLDGGDWAGVWTNRIHIRGMNRLGYEEYPLRLYPIWKTEKRL